MPVTQEKNVPKNAASYRIFLIGATGRRFECLCGMDDFTDNRERATPIEHRTRGQLYAATAGGDTPNRTGSFSYPLMTENNAQADAFLDVIMGREDWEAESTGPTGAGTPGDPYITPDKHVVDMEVIVLGAAVDGGDMVRTFSKVWFQPSESAALDETKIALNWTCYGPATETGPA